MNATFSPATLLFSDIFIRDIFGGDIFNGYRDHRGFASVRPTQAQGRRATSSATIQEACVFMKCSWLHFLSLSISINAGGQCPSLLSVYLQPTMYGNCTDDPLLCQHVHVKLIGDPYRANMGAF